MITLRPANDFEQHFERVCTLEKLIFPDPIATDMNTCQLVFLPMAKKGRYFAWDAFSKNRCIASASFFIEKARGGPLFATLNSAAIRKTYRGQGLYYDLLYARIEKIKELKLPFFEVQCAFDNEPMVDFWSKQELLGKVKYMGHFYHNYYSYRKKTRMLEFRGRLKDW